MKRREYQNEGKRDNSRLLKLGSPKERLQLAAEVKEAVDENEETT